MRIAIFVSIIIFLFLAVVILGAYFVSQKQLEAMLPLPSEKTEKNIDQINQQEIVLPSPNKTSKVSIEESLSKRRSVREYKDEYLVLAEISQVLWAAQGITSEEFGGRTAPSAGALYPLEVYLVARKIENIKPAVYKYLPKEHKLNRVLEGDIGGELAKVAQEFASRAPAILIFSAVFERTTQKYGERGVQYVFMEAGHAAQNVCLQVQGLGMGTVTVGAFADEKLKTILNMPEQETPLYIMPIGKIE